MMMMIIMIRIVMSIVTFMTAMTIMMMINDEYHLCDIANYHIMAVAMAMSIMI